MEEETRKLTPDEESEREAWLSSVAEEREMRQFGEIDYDNWVDHYDGTR